MLIRFRSVHSWLFILMLGVVVANTPLASDLDGGTAYLDALKSKDFVAVQTLVKQSIFPENLETLESIIDTFTTEQIKAIFNEFKKYDIAFSQVSGKWKFFNPIIYALGKGKFEVARSLTEINPEFANIRQSSGKSYDSYRPITFAILSGNRETIKSLVALGGKIQYLEGLSSMNSENTLLRNVPDSRTPVRTVLSFTADKDFQSFLMELGATPYISWSETKLSRTGVVNDNNVNFREIASTTGKVIRKLQKKEKVDVLGFDSRLVTIGSASGIWFNVKDSQGISGWVFSEFLDNTSWYE